MPTVTPVDYDPFAATSPKLTEVDYDPFGEGQKQAAAAPAAPKSYLENQGQMAREAFDTMKGGLATSFDPQASIGAKAMGRVQAGLGGLSYIASPVNAALRTFVGDPVQEATGIPRDYTEFAAGLAIPGIGPTRLGGMGAKVVSKAPNAAELKASYVASKEAPEVAAVKIRPEAMARQADELAPVLNKEWLDPEAAPRTYRILGKLTNPAEGSFTTMQSVDSARRRLGDVIAAGGEDAAAAKIVKSRLDDWLSKPLPADDVLSGNPTVAHEIMMGGRQDYTAGKIGEAFDKKINKAQARANTTYSGLNLQNQIRQKAEAFLDSADSRALSAAERKMVEGVRDGTATENTLRYVGKSLGGGGGMHAFNVGAAGGAGGLLSGVGGAGFLLPVVGYATTKLASHLTMKQAERVSEALRSRSPLGKQLNASLASWGKYAKIAEQKPMTPRIVSMLAIQSRNLSNNLKDAGIEVSPVDLVRGVGLEQEDGR